MIPQDKPEEPPHGPDDGGDDKAIRKVAVGAAHKVGRRPDDSDLDPVAKKARSYKEFMALKAAARA